jgi:sugar/nucleoside kinase (ribokinase family)
VSAAPRVLVIGDVMQDVIVRPSGPVVAGSDRTARIEMHPGGSAASQAVWMARCGLGVDFVARVGRVDVATLTSDFADAGVTARLAPDDRAQTGRLIVLLDPEGQRSFLTDRGANESLGAADIDWQTLPKPDFVQLSGYSVVTEATRAMMGSVRARLGGTPFGFDPASAGFIHEIGRDAFLDASAGAAIIFPNEDEAEALTGLTDPSAQLDRLTSFYPLVVLKRGAHGCMARRGAEICEVRSPQVTVVDTTGAGDAFVAGFLSAHLKGASPRAALERAVATGAEAVASLGSRPVRWPSTFERDSGV